MSSFLFSQQFRGCLVRLIFMVCEISLTAAVLWDDASRIYSEQHIAFLSNSRLALSYIYNCNMYA